MKKYIRSFLYKKILVGNWVRVVSALILLTAVLSSVWLESKTSLVNASNAKTIDTVIQNSAKKDRELKYIHAEKVRIIAEKAAAEKKYQELIAPDVPKLAEGQATFVRKINTKKPVVFLTIDDGAVKSPEAFAFIKEKRLNATLFLTDNLIKDNYDYFKQYQSIGTKIQDHTLSHPKLLKLNQAAQKTEICGSRDTITAIYSESPKLFRPPYGEYNASTIAAAKQCGMTSVVHWSAKANGGSMQYQNGYHLVAGDIVLMHFRPEVVDDLKAFYNEATSQGLTPAYLTDWL
jgi:peptidoglycan/xylan/chitin deacetylase (PgdA/CDA1 family)